MVTVGGVGECYPHPESSRDDGKESEAEGKFRRGEREEFGGDGEEGGNEEDGEEAVEDCGPVLGLCECGEGGREGREGWKG